MEEITRAPPPTDQLDALPDDELKQIITRAEEIIKAREDKRRKSALIEMRKLAKAHGLTFCAKKKPARRTRRPNKPEE